MLRGLMSGDNGQWHWVASQTHDDRFLMFCAVSPVEVPPRKRATVAVVCWSLAEGFRRKADECDASAVGIVKALAESIASTDQNCG
jgi:hypothetical protein